jgi:ferredoxin
MAKINSSCIGCGVCASIAPDIFVVQGVPAQVVKQPETPEEKTSFEQAKASCPVGAIED